MSLTPPAAQGAYGQWEEQARDLIVAAMTQRSLSYKDLSRRLATMGIEESADQINRKINRKRFSAAFLLICLAAMDVESVPVYRCPTQAA
ncbi:DUF6471 domain-containing protein [Burkholderia aenigmatica]|uniref:DUF6471 domain-containing protein n=1 Tax=Burkholderia cepacia complex TaxID=87882 RepID=UPI00158A1C21|nr:MULTISPECIES: DUF6471 domain-containing protein [Burkholderia cepacia complex]UKD16741.1 DUF6471 domain-containing protein [Burkholderia aenigmatica]